MKVLLSATTCVENCFDSLLRLRLLPVQSSDEGALGFAPLLIVMSSQQCADNAGTAARTLITGMLHYLPSHIHQICARLVVSTLLLELLLQPVCDPYLLLFEAHKIALD